MTDETMTHEPCTGCEAEGVETWEEFFYFTPWDDEETSTGCWYCQECNDAGPEEGYFYCDWCNRDILDTNRNGRMLYYRIMYECEMVCLRCIEEVLLEKGIAGFEDKIEEVRGGSIFGMFFNVGELEEAGWTADPAWHNRRIDSTLAYELGQRAWEHHKAGRLVIIEYERLSILGSEGYITLYTKQKKDNT